ncbi:MAG: glutaredoxin family protein [Anaerolineae bacterium]
MRAEEFFGKHGISYRTVNIEEDKAAARKVKGWTGFHTVPTIVIADEGSTEPFSPPSPLAKRQSPRGVNRGSMISEPSDEQLEEFLRQHGLL